MNDLVQWGLQIVQWVQSFRNPLFDQFFLSINLLGDEDFYLLFLPVLFWYVEKKLAVRMGVLFLFSLFTNQFLKDFFAAPRPYQVDARLYAPVQQPGYGLPSAHAQGTVTVWGYLATQFRKQFWWVLAFAIPPVVSIGRMYLGDHFPQDVAAGLALGALFVAGYLVLEPRASLWLASLRPSVQIALVLIVTLVLAALNFNIDASKLIGTFLGFCTSLIFELKWVGFDVRAVWWKQLVKLALGLAIAFALRLGLKAILPPTALFNFMRYAVIGIWVGIGAPWVFVAMRLAGRVSRPSVPQVEAAFEPAGE